jgi:hypothetical protein
MTTYQLQLLLRTALLVTTVIAASSAIADRKWERSTSGGLTVIVDDAKSGATVDAVLDEVHDLKELGLSVPSDRPIIIILTSDSREVLGAWPKGVAIEGLGGVTNGFSDKIYAIVDRSKHNSSYNLRHELVHVLLREKYLNIPLWLDEGLADNLSSYHIEGGAIRLDQIGARHRWRQGSCGVDVTFSQVLDRNIQNAGYSNGGGAVLHISDLVARYLIDKHGLAKIFEFIDASSTTSQTDALKAVFGVEPEQLNDQALQYCKTGLESKSLPHQSNAHNVHATMSLDSDSFRWIYLEMVSRVAGHTVEAVDIYEKYLSSVPNDSMALRGLGIALVYKGDYSDARTYFTRTGHLFDADPTVGYHRLLACQKDSNCGTSEDIEEMTARLKTLRPDLVGESGEFDTQSGNHVEDSEDDGGFLPEDGPKASEYGPDLMTSKKFETSLAKKPNLAPPDTPESVAIRLIDEIKRSHENWELRSPGFDDVSKDWNYTLNGKRISRNSSIAFMRQTVMRDIILDQFEVTAVGSFPARIIVTYRRQNTFLQNNKKKGKVFSVFLKDTYDYINANWKETKLEAITAK